MALAGLCPIRHEAEKVGRIQIREARHDGAQTAIGSEERHGGGEHRSLQCPPDDGCANVGPAGFDDLAKIVTVANVEAAPSWRHRVVGQDDAIEPDDRHAGRKSHVQVGELGQQGLQCFVTQLARQVGRGVRQAVDVVLELCIHLACDSSGVGQLLVREQFFKL